MNRCILEGTALIMLASVGLGIIVPLLWVPVYTVFKVVAGIILTIVCFITLLFGLHELLQGMKW
jgi:hypothetical protein